MRTLALAGVAALLLGVAALPSVADAAIIVSDTIGETRTGPVAGTSTVLINPLEPQWAPNDTVAAGAKWISYAANTGSTGPALNATMEVRENFSLTGGSNRSVLVSVLADDTAQVDIYQGSTLIDNLRNYAGGTNGPCQQAVIGCLAKFASNDLSSILTVGTIYTLVVTGIQKVANTPFGIQYAVSEVPLPGAVLLFGSALAGLGVMRRRRKSDTAPVAA